MSEKKYRVKIRTHYGLDLHDYYSEIVDENGLSKLKKAYKTNTPCHGHTYDTPNDDIVYIEEIKESI